MVECSVENDRGISVTPQSVKVLHVQLGGSGVRVNGIAPGYVPTKFSAALVQSPELRQAQARLHRCLCICMQSAAFCVNLVG